MLLALPQETLLYIFSFLDIPDLASLSRVSKQLALLTADPVLHRTRLRVVTPSRVQHFLFGRSPEGIPIRPTLIDLVHRGVMRGLQVERRLREGDYLYTHQSVRQYESSLHLRRTHTKVLLSSYLRSRLSPPSALESLYSSHILPDVESSMLSISRSLLPVLHKLKWSIQKDNTSRVIRSHGTFSTMESTESSHPFGGGFRVWAELKGANIFGDSERVRLALCPDVKKMIKFYERMT